MAKREKGKVIVRHRGFAILKSSLSYDVVKLSKFATGGKKGEETHANMSFHATLGGALSEMAARIRGQHIESKAPMSLEELVREIKEINAELVREFDIRA